MSPDDPDDVESSPEESVEEPVTETEFSQRSDQAAKSEAVEMSEGEAAEESDSPADLPVQLDDDETAEKSDDGQIVESDNPEEVDELQHGEDDDQSQKLDPVQTDEDTVSEAAQEMPVSLNDLSSEEMEKREEFPVDSSRAEDNDKEPQALEPFPDFEPEASEVKEIPDAVDESLSVEPSDPDDGLRANKIDPDDQPQQIEADESAQLSEASQTVQNNEMDPPVEVSDLQYSETVEAPHSTQPEAEKAENIPELVKEGDDVDLAQAVAPVEETAEAEVAELPVADEHLEDAQKSAQDEAWEADAVQTNDTAIRSDAPPASEDQDRAGPLDSNQPVEAEVVDEISDSLLPVDTAQPAEISEREAPENSVADISTPPQIPEDAQELQAVELDQVPDSEFAQKPLDAPEEVEVSAPDFSVTNNEEQAQQPDPIDQLSDVQPVQCESESIIPEPSFAAEAAEVEVAENLRDVETNDTIQELSGKRQEQVASLNERDEPENAGRLEDNLEVLSRDQLVEPVSERNVGAVEEKVDSIDEEDERDMRPEPRDNVQSLERDASDFLAVDKRDLETNQAAETFDQNFRTAETAAQSADVSQSNIDEHSAQSHDHDQLEHDAMRLESEMAANLEDNQVAANARELAAQNDQDPTRQPFDPHFAPALENASLPEEEEKSKHSDSSESAGLIAEEKEAAAEVKQQSEREEAQRVAEDVQEAAFLEGIKSEGMHFSEKSPTESAPILKSPDSQEKVTVEGPEEFSKYAQRAYASYFSEIPALLSLWEKAKTGQDGKERENSRHGFNGARDSFWRMVRDDKNEDGQFVQKILKAAGFDLSGSGAPVLGVESTSSGETNSSNLSLKQVQDRHTAEVNMPTRRGKSLTPEQSANRKTTSLSLDIDHADPASLSHRWLDPKNLQFMFGDDNRYYKRDAYGADGKLIVKTQPPKTGEEVV